MMVRWARGVAAIGAMVVLLTGCVVPPGYGYARTSFVVGGPQVAFTFSDGVEGYYEPAYGTYIYGDGGYYYRWVGSSWVYASSYGGPWEPVVTTMYLPPLLIYGPPPPTVAYRPYFVWWRLHAAPWYEVNHPRWWYQHRPYIRHYALWRDHVVRFYENHPGQRPVMRPLFRGREQRLDRAPRPQRLRRYQQRRFHDGRPPAYRQPPRFRKPPMRGRPDRGRPRRRRREHPERP
ncbi:MAG: hypothetical protein ACYDEV_06125 [Acidiferrobacter sp.]